MPRKLDETVPRRPTFVIRGEEDVGYSAVGEKVMEEVGASGHGEGEAVDVQSGGLRGFRGLYFCLEVRG